MIALVPPYLPEYLHRTATRTPGAIDDAMCALDIDLSDNGDLRRFNEVLDLHGNSPLDYCVGTANFVTADNEWHAKDTSPGSYAVYVCTKVRDFLTGKHGGVGILCQSSVLISFASVP